MLLAGCQKPGGAGRAIRFSAVTSQPGQTKTAYSGVVDASGWERIDWSNNDIIRIYSDKAVRDNDHDYHWADYKVKSYEDGTEVKISKADLNANTTGTDLNWGDGGHKFFGVYPASAGGSAADMGTGAVTLSGEIPTAQSGTLSTMYMTAYASGQTESAGITLQFTPAFSAFHISAGSDVDMTIHSVTLSAATNPIAGAFSGSCTSEWSYSTVSTEKTITLDMDDYALSAGNTVDLTILALPLEMTGLTLTFDVTPDGGARGNRNLALKVAKATTLYGHNLAAGDFIIFNPCRQARISGLIVPGWNWTVDNDTDVYMRADENIDPWTNQDSSISYGNTDPVINAGKLSGTSPDFNFNLYSPVGKQWKVTVLTAASGGSVATGVHLVQKEGGVANGNEGDGVLTGTIGSPSTVEFTLSGASETYWLSFSVIIDGVEYSINSEVARSAGPKEITLS